MRASAPRGRRAPTLAELVLRGAEVTLCELEAQDRARTTFVERLRAAPPPDLAEVARIRHAAHRP